MDPLASAWQEMRDGKQPRSSKTWQSDGGCLVAWGDNAWSLAIQLVDWLNVQGGMVQCQGIGPDGTWVIVSRLVMVMGCW